MLNSKPGISSIAMAVLAEPETKRIHIAQLADEIAIRRLMLSDCSYSCNTARDPNVNRTNLLDA